MKTPSISRRHLTGLLASMALLCAGHAQAQSWPNHPVRVIVPFPASGATDLVARVAPAVQAHALRIAATPAIAAYYAKFKA